MSVPRSAVCGLAVVLLGALWACGEGAVTPTPPPPPAPEPAAPATLLVVAGDRQEGKAGAPLPAEVVVRVLDQHEQRLPGATVSFEVLAGGGSVDSTTIITDSAGEATVTWTLGSTEGSQELAASAGSATPAVAWATASGCGLVNCALRQSPDGEWTVLALETYERSGQAMHPDVIRRSNVSRWFWMGITPYPDGDATFENPSLFLSANGEYWRVPRGLTNPVVHPLTGYLSDPDLVYDRSTRKLWLYYRAVVGGQNEIFVVRSHDGVTWGLPIKVVTAPNHQVVSPAVVHGAPDAPWQMWSVNTFDGGCVAIASTVQRRISTDGLEWSGAIGTDLAQPGRITWHLDVQWIRARAEYWALFSTFAPGDGCATSEIYFARSPDGTHWQTYPAPLFRHGVIPEFSTTVYRATFLTSANADTVQFWVSGAQFAASHYIWRTATITRRTEDVFAQLEGPAAQDTPEERAARRLLPPPEPDLPAGRGVPDRQRGGGSGPRSSRGPG
jgi:hypothetical protein